MRGLLALVMVAGCGSSRTADSSAGDASAAARCAQLDQQITDALAQHGTCDTNADCGLVGGQLGDPTCDCAPYVGSCGGLAMELNAPQLAHAKQMMQDYVAAGCALAKVCDCAPSGPLQCSADHRCVAAERSCLGPPPDGGVAHGW